MEDNLYSYSALDNKGHLVSLSSYQGKILLIVVTSLHSPFVSEYKDLERLYILHQREGFEILDFPTDQFWGETPENDAEIDSFCKENYHTTFPRFAKVDVKGESAHPLFLYLTKKKKFPGFDPSNPLSPVFADRYIKQGPGWEKDSSLKGPFTMFLISREGKVKKRFELTTPFEKIEKEVLHLLDNDSGVEK